MEMRPVSLAFWTSEAIDILSYNTSRGLWNQGDGPYSSMINTDELLMAVWLKENAVPVLVFTNWNIRNAWHKLLLSPSPVCRAVKPDICRSLIVVFKSVYCVRWQNLTLHVPLFSFVNKNTLTYIIKTEPCRVKKNRLKLKCYNNLGFNSFHLTVSSTWSSFLIAQRSASNTWARTKEGSSAGQRGKISHGRRDYSWLRSSEKR